MGGSVPCLFCLLVGDPRLPSTTPALHPTLKQGAIPKISDLPAPWGDKPYTAPPAEELAASGYLPARYPEAWSPLKDVQVA